MKKNAILLILLGLSAVLVSGQLKPRVAGLEENSEYMGLLAREHELREKEDSLNSIVSSIRVQFREQSDRREFFRNEILRLEGEIFDVRNETGIVTGKINMIEQEFIMSNLDKSPDIITPDHGPDGGNKHVKTFANLIANDFFRLKLPAQDYASLTEAQEKESRVANYIDIYMTNYGSMLALSEAYYSATNAVDADSIMSKYKAVEDLSLLMEDSISNGMNYIFDNKAYAYNYLLDRLNMMDILTEFERKGVEMRDKEAGIKAYAMSGVVATYPVRKKLLFDYEKLFAAHLKLDKALDSLNKAEAAISAVDFSVPKLDMKERLFLDYAGIEIHTPAKYNASNPIPKSEIYEKGVIYRVLVGTYTRMQPVSVFKGVYPLGYIKGDDNRYRYYAGGFGNRAKAEEAADQLKKHGFRDPKIAVWDYGVYTVLDGSGKQAPDEGRLFRIELEGVGNQIPDTVKQLVKEVAGDKDILRVGNLFQISPFSSAAEAEKLAEAIRESDSKLTVKIREIPL